MMAALQQGRVVFNPLPLTEYQNPDLVPRIQSIVKGAYNKLIVLAESGSHNQPNTQEGQMQIKLRNLLNLLNTQKNLILPITQGFIFQILVPP